MNNEHPITPYRQELREKTLRTAMNLFKKKGVKAVKMDDISVAMGISKRTLYELYENKEMLLMEGVKFDHIESTHEMDLFVQEKERNEIEIVAMFIQMQIKDLNSINPLFFTEMHRYKRVVNYLQERHRQRRKYTQEFIRKGVEHGYFRKNLNYNIVGDMGDAVMSYVMEHRLYETYPIRELFLNYVYVLMNGFCTEKGTAELEKLLRNIDE